MAYIDKQKEIENKRLYRIKRKKEIRDYNKYYFSTPNGKEAKRKANKKYLNSEKGREIIRQKKKRAYQKNKEKIKIAAKSHRQTPRGKESSNRHWTKRHRELGFNPLNKPFLNAIAHHTTKDDVIYIPMNVHKSIRHNLETGYHMNEINKLAIQFLGTI